MKLENIVCSGSFNQELNLKLLSSSDSRIEYGKNKYPGAYIKFDNHSVTIYRTGKYIMPGMRSFEDVTQSFDTVKQILAPFCDIDLFQEPSVRNMVCSAQYSSPLLLDTLFIEMLSEDLDVVYEPEAFPGLIYKTKDCTYNVFQSGKFLILGCTDALKAEECELRFTQLLDEINGRH